MRILLSLFLLLFLIPIFNISLAVSITMGVPPSAYNGEEIKIIVSGIDKPKSIRLSDYVHQKSCTQIPPNIEIKLKMPESGDTAVVELVELVTNPADCAQAKLIVDDRGFYIARQISLSPSPATIGTCSINAGGQLAENNCKADYIPYADFSVTNPVCLCKAVSDARCNTSTAISAIESCSSSSLTSPVVRCGANLSGYSCKLYSQQFCMNGAASPENVVCQPISQGSPCCQDNYIFSSSSRVCEAKAGSSGGHGKFLCAAGFGCNTTTQQCEAGGTSAFIPPGICPNETCKTAIGDIPTKPAEIISRFFSLLLGLAGGIALILIIISGYRLMTSGANAEAVQGARETLTSAIVGLLFIIFSLVILEVVGVDILKIPSLKP